MEYRIDVALLDAAMSSTPAHVRSANRRRKRYVFDEDTQTLLYEEWGMEPRYALSEVSDFCRGELRDRAAPPSLAMGHVAEWMAFLELKSLNIDAQRVLTYTRSGASQRYFPMPDIIYSDPKAPSVGALEVKATSALDFRKYFVSHGRFVRPDVCKKLLKGRERALDQLGRTRRTSGSTAHSLRTRSATMPFPVSNTSAASVAFWDGRMQSIGVSPLVYAPTMCLDESDKLCLCLREPPDAFVAMFRNSHFYWERREPFNEGVFFMLYRAWVRWCRNGLSDGVREATVNLAKVLREYSDGIDYARGGVSNREQHLGFLAEYLSDVLRYLHIAHVEFDRDLQVVSFEPVCGGFDEIDPTGVPSAGLYEGEYQGEMATIRVTEGLRAGVVVRYRFPRDVTSLAEASWCAQRLFNIVAHVFFRARNIQSRSPPLRIGALREEPWWFLNHARSQEWVVGLEPPLLQMWLSGDGGRLFVRGDGEAVLRLGVSASETFGGSDRPRRQVDGSGGNSDVSAGGA